MYLINKYLLNQFLNIKISLFFILFIVVSMVFFIQIAKITSIIEINFIDLLNLYAFMIPRIIIFTFPISFFISLTLCLYKLSKENESIVLFTLGISPKLIANFYLKLSIIFSIFLLIISFVFIPIAFNLQDNFIYYKKTQINFNLKIGKFGQKFSSWLIFIQDQNNNIYKDIIMYQPTHNNEKEQLIIAKEAKIENENNNMVLKLFNGKIYNFKDRQSVLFGEFENMIINTKLKLNDIVTKPFYLYYEDINQDDKKKKEFVIYTLLAIFPIASVFFAIVFGLVTYRYEKGFVYFGIFLIIASYFGLLTLFYKPPILATILIFISFFISSIYYFKFKILKRY